MYEFIALSLIGLALWYLRAKLWFVIRLAWNKVHPWSLAKFDTWLWEREK